MLNFWFPLVFGHPFAHLHICKFAHQHITQAYDAK
jgi:hypothetical protein